MTPRRRRLLKWLVPAILGVGVLAYLFSDAPGDGQFLTGADTAFGIDLASADDRVLLYRPPTLEISSLANDYPTATLSLGLRSADDMPQRIDVVAQLPEHTTVTDLTVSEAGDVREHVTVPPGFTADLPTPTGTAVFRTAPNADRSSSLRLLRIPVMVSANGTVVEIQATVNRSRFSTAGSPIGARHVSIQFGETTMIEAQQVNTLPRDPTFDGPARELRVGLGGLRLDRSSVAADPNGTRANRVVWTQPRGAAFGALEVNLTVEDARIRSIMSVVEIILNLLIGAWIGVITNRTLLTRHRRIPSPTTTT